MLRHPLLPKYPCGPGETHAGTPPTVPRSRQCSTQIFGRRDAIKWYYLSLEQGRLNTIDEPVGQLKTERMNAEIERSTMI